VQVVSVVQSSGFIRSDSGEPSSQRRLCTPAGMEAHDEEEEDAARPKASAVALLPVCAQA